jgi:HEAT repeat protein
VVNRWRREAVQAVRNRLESIIAAFGQPGLDVLRALLDTAEPREKAAALGLLRRLGGVRDPSVPARFIADPDTSVRREALRALASVGHAAGDAFGRALETLDDAIQPGLVEELARVGGRDAVPILAHLAAVIDRDAIAPATHASVIAALRLAGTADAVDALEKTCRHFEWSAPYRSYRFCAAAAAALAQIGNAPARQALESIGSGAPVVPRFLGRRELHRMGGVSPAGGLS